MNGLLVLFIFIVNSTWVNAKSDLENLIRESWKNSRAVKTLDTSIEYASNDRIRRFLPNDPQLFYANQDNSSWEQFGVSIPIGFPGKSFNLLKLDEAKYQSTKIEQQAYKLELASKITEAYGSCVGKKKTLEMMNQEISDLETLHSNVKTLYVNGRATQAELIMVELQIRQLKNDYLSEKNYVELSCKNLSELAGGANLNEDDLPSEISTTLLSELGEGSVDVKRSLADILTSSAIAETSMWKSMPDFNLSFLRNKYRIQLATPNGELWTNSVMVQFNFPIFSFFADARRERAFANIAKAKANMERNISYQEQETQKLEYKRLSERLREINSNEIPKSETLLSNSLSYYKSGKLSFAELIMSRKIAYDLKVQKIRVNVEMLLAQLKCLELCKEI
jgi:outer membrane protein TolC